MGETGAMEETESVETSAISWTTFHHSVLPLLHLLSCLGTYISQPIWLPELLLSPEIYSLQQSSLLWQNFIYPSGLPSGLLQPLLGKKVSLNTYSVWLPFNSVYFNTDSGFNSLCLLCLWYLGCVKTSSHYTSYLCLSAPCLVWPVSQPMSSNTFSMSEWST